MPIDYFHEFEDCCAYCGGSYEHDDHVRAYSSGGTFTIPCCAECNHSKYNKGLKTWLREVRDYWLKNGMRLLHITRENVIGYRKLCMKCIMNSLEDSYLLPNIRMEGQTSRCYLTMIEKASKDEETS